MQPLGDGMMVRCEDPALTMRLGLAIVSEARATPALPAVRVGMHTGSAMQRDGDWYGAAVNVASRLCSAAGGEEVLVSEATCAAAGRRAPGVDLGDERLHWLRNVRDPVRARLVSERECRLLEHPEHSAPSDAACAPTAGTPGARRWKARLEPRAGRTRAPPQWRARCHPAPMSRPTRKQRQATTRACLLEVSCPRPAR